VKKSIVILPVMLIFFGMLVCCSSEKDPARAKMQFDMELDAINDKASVEFKSAKHYELILNASEMVNWVNQDNPILTRTKKIQEFNYTLRYVPLSYLIANELKKPSITIAEYDSLLTEYDGMEYFELRIQIDGFNDETAKYQLDDMGLYQQRIVYMSFAMQENLKIVDEKGIEAPCELFHFERTYGIAPYATFLMGFAKSKLAEAKEYTVVFEDNLFNKGILKFNWEISQLHNVPKLFVL
jgi:hypothetical protein